MLSSIVLVVLAAAVAVEVTRASRIDVCVLAFARHFTSAMRTRVTFCFLPVLIVIKVRLNNSDGRQAERGRENHRRRKERPSKVKIMINDALLKSRLGHLESTVRVFFITLVIPKWGKTKFQAETIIHSSGHFSDLAIDVDLIIELKSTAVACWQLTRAAARGIWLVSYLSTPICTMRICFNLMWCRRRRERSTQTQDALTWVGGHNQPSKRRQRKQLLFSVAERTRINLVVDYGKPTQLCYSLCFEHRHLQLIESTAVERQCSENGSVQCKCHPLTRLNHRVRHCSSQENGHWHLWS